MTTLQEEYDNNKIIIENYLKRQEELKIVIDREKKINLMTDDKFDIIQEQLNKILELQKEYNIIVSDRKLPITEKYLPFPYDVNDIIRKKIITDSKLKIEQEYISVLVNKFKYTILNEVGDDLCRTIRLYTNDYLENPAETFKNKLEEYFDYYKNKLEEYLDLKKCDKGYKNIFNRSICKEFLNKKQHRKQIQGIYNNIYVSIIKPLRDIITLLTDDIELLEPNSNYTKIKSFSGFSILKKNGHFNSNQYKKLCYEILNIFKSYSDILNHMNINNYGVNMTYNYWDLLCEEQIDYNKLGCLAFKIDSWNN